MSPWLKLVAKQWEKAQWNAGMCQYQHPHWALITLRKPKVLCKSCWTLCIFCSWSYRGACFQFVPSVSHQSAYFDTFTGIFRKCDSANAFWTRYLETAIGWCFRIVQKSAQMSYMVVLLIVPPNQWYGQICQRLISQSNLRGDAELVRPNSTNSNPNSLYTICTELVPVFHHSNVVLTFDWVQQSLLLLVTHTSKCEICYFKALR